MNNFEDFIKNTKRLEGLMTPKEGAIISATVHSNGYTSAKVEGRGIDALALLMFLTEKNY